MKQLLGDDFFFFFANASPNSVARVSCPHWLAHGTSACDRFSLAKHHVKSVSSARTKPVVCLLCSPGAQTYNLELPSTHSRGAIFRRCFPSFKQFSVLDDAKWNLRDSCARHVAPDVEIVWTFSPPMFWWDRFDRSLRQAASAFAPWTVSRLICHLVNDSAASNWPSCSCDGKVRTRQC